MPFFSSAQDKNLHLLPPNDHNGEFKSDNSPITPDTPDSIEKSTLPLISNHDHEKSSIIVSTQYVDDFTDNADFQALSKRDATLKHRIRIFKFVLRTLTFLFALYDLTTMSYTLALFQHTYRLRRTLYLPPTPITRGPWHADSKNWPTYLLLTIAAVSCLASFLILALYLHSVAAANKASARFGHLAYTIFAAHVVVWIATAITYRRAKTGTDLWGWSCSHEARVVLQPFFRDVVDFGLSCRIQTSSWAVSVAQAVLTVLNFLLYYISFKRHRSKTGLRSLSLSLSPTASARDGQQEQQPRLVEDPEKQPKSEKETNEKEGRKQDQEQGKVMMGEDGAEGKTGGEGEGEGKEEEEPLHKTLRRPALKAVMGYITTFVNVFN